jgi:3-oxosteroid 1-dehydrogenase
METEGKMPNSSEKKISRRDFIKAAGIGAAGVAAVGGLSSVLSSCTTATTPTALAPTKYDYTADVVVVGTGGAASAAASVAHAQGASVIMLEKGAALGGTTMKSGGEPWIPNNRFLKAQGIVDNRDDCLKFMARGNYPQRYNPSDPKYGLSDYEYNHLAALYDNGSQAIDYFMQIGACQFVQAIAFGLNAPPPDYLDHVPENKVLHGRLVAPTNTSGTTGAGPDLIRQFRAYLDGAKITTLLSHRVQQIFINDKGAVVGVQALNSGAVTPVTVNVKANKAVVFGSGGYTHNKEFIIQYQKGPTFGGCAVITNEGDLIYMAQALGAQMYNMNGAWNAEIPLEQALALSSTPNDIWQPIGDSMIYVNKYGVRVTNEKRDYNDRTKIHFYWDPINQEYPNEVMCMIYDQRTKDLFAAGPGGYPIPKSGVTDPAEITGQTWHDLAVNINDHVNQIGGKIGTWRLDPSFEANLIATVTKFNGFANTGKDLDFHRGDFPYDKEWYQEFSIPAPGTKWPANDKPNITMYPFTDQGPYYCYLVAGGTLDTNGGPKVNEKCQVMNTKDNPVPGLYAAGNCSAVFMPYYIAGGATLGNALTMGYVAGMNAVKEPAR